MKSYTVTIPIAARIYFEVEASSEQEAKQKALDLQKSLNPPSEECPEPLEVSVQDNGEVEE